MFAIVVVVYFDIFYIEHITLLCVLLTVGSKSYSQALLKKNLLPS